MDCQYCIKGVEATVLLIAGTDQCMETSKWQVCDRHWPALDSALTFALDGCEPAHQYAIGLLTDLSGNADEEWTRAELGEHTVDALVKYLEPTSVSCEGCGRNCTSVTEAVHCGQKHVADERQKMAVKAEKLRAEKAEARHRKMIDEQFAYSRGGNTAPPTYTPCAGCHKIFTHAGYWENGLCDECEIAMKIKKQARSWGRKLKNRMGNSI